MIWHEFQHHLRQEFRNWLDYLKSLNSKYTLLQALIYLVITTVVFAHKSTSTPELLSSIGNATFMYITLTLCLMSLLGRVELFVAYFVILLYVIFVGQYLLEIALIAFFVWVVLLLQFVIASAYRKTRITQRRDKLKQFLLTHIDEENLIPITNVAVEVAKDATPQRGVLIVESESRLELHQLLMKRSFNEICSAETEWQLIKFDRKNAFLLLHITSNDFETFTIALLLGTSPRIKSTLQYDAVRPSFLILLEELERLIIVSKELISPQDLWAGFTGFGGGTVEDWWNIETGLQLSIKPLPSWKSYYKPNHIHLPGASWQERYHDYIVETN